MICRRCDRGNRYCPPCSKLAPARRQCRAGRRYQKTEAGKANHKARQQRYLERLDQKAHSAQSVVESASAAEEMKERLLSEAESIAAPHPAGSRPTSALAAKLHCEPAQPSAFIGLDTCNPLPLNRPNASRSQEKMTHRGDLTGEVEPPCAPVTDEADNERRHEPPGIRSSQERCDFCGRACLCTGSRPLARPARMFRRTPRLPRYRPRQTGEPIGVSE